MELFALDAELGELEVALEPLQAHARLDILPTLAWHLRQRDGLRALALADEAQGWLASSAHAEHERQQIQARLDLLRGEVAWLNADLDQALADCHRGQAAFYKLGNAAGQGDAHMLEAQIMGDRGQALLAEAHWSAAAHAAMLARDPTRIGVAQIAKARSELLRDIRRAESPQRFSVLEPGSETHPGVVALHNEYLGLCAALRGDFAESTAYYTTSQETAARSGQYRICVESTSLLGRSYAKLNDHESSLSWMQRALALARLRPWPWSLGVCLMHFGETLRNFGRHQAASELLHEALQTLTPLAASRPYTWTLMFLAHLERDMGEYEASLAHYRELGTRAQSLKHNEVVMDASLGEAIALSLLQRPREALALALSVLEQARGLAHVLRQTDVLKALADMHARHALPPPPEMREATAVLHYLNQAVELMAGIGGFTPPPELLEQLAHEYAQRRDFARAYEFSQRAGVARNKIHGQEATDRAIAMQVHHQTERARVEMAYHRQLAAAQQKRAQALQQTSETLEQLGQIGQEITAQLRFDAVFEALARHAQSMLAADAFAICLVHPDGQHLSTSYVLERGQPLPVELIALNDPFANSARCVRERRELVAHLPPEQHDPSLVPGTLHTLSRLYSPLMVGEQVLGVMSVQSAKPHAYGEREQTIFRSLCAYGAIALDNARAYEQLRLARAKMLAQDKLAALGSLVAGVAQAMNSPLGNAVLVAETLQHRAAGVATKLEAKQLRRAELQGFAQESAQASELLVGALQQASRLVQSFIRLTGQGPAEPRQEFELFAVGQQLRRGLQARLDSADLRLRLTLPEGLMMTGYPQALTHVLTQLLDNVLLHAYPPAHRAAERLVTLAAASPGPGRVLITLQDDGAGVAAEHLPRLFDPFFTVAVAGNGPAGYNSGRGLGLFVCHTLVSTLWGGDMVAVSTPGQGTRFTLDLPQHAAGGKP
nr:ATP-binding protein [uncultured Roseateles sp.]